MSLKETLRADMIAAQRAGDKEKRDTYRLIMAAIKQVEIDERIELDDEGVQTVLSKQAKQIKETIADLEKAGRREMIAPETAALQLVESYLPQMMSREEITEIAAQVIAELGVTDAKGTGQVMGRLMGQLKGKADGRLVNEVVRGLLQS